MKTWIVKGEWKHKKTGITYASSFIVVNNGEDPIKTLEEQIDFSGVVYLRGVIEAIEVPTVYRIND